MAVRRVTFRLYPKPTAAKKLLWARKMHQLLYFNAAIGNRLQYEKFGCSVSYLEQQNSLPAFKQVWPEYKELGQAQFASNIKTG
ncbi:transposase [Microseira wollei NIES-4236]|uniref:Transposase n=1 Tax=Microseira wollei NIES-4236 TaxID=2530354 RepID=A0AAV3XE05_9CYAN|nr:hypothetical protein [Microseira wollei]GET39696.1 transposase [Microseira wollei NIES-4236]